MVEKIYKQLDKIEDLRKIALLSKKHSSIDEIVKEIETLSLTKLNKDEIVIAILTSLIFRGEKE